MKGPNQAQSLGGLAWGAYLGVVSLEIFKQVMLDWVKRTTGITGLWQPSVHSDVAF
jgi:hypothetical protein